ncbi:MAG: C25 family cysteine peptidase [Anaerolineae bacterium]
MDTLRRRYSFLALAALGGLLLLVPALGVGANPAPPEPDALFDMLALTAAPLRALTAAPTLPTPAAPIPLPDPVWRIGIITDGIYTLDYATLAAAGVPVTGAALADVHLFWRGQEVALEAVGTGTFDPGDALIFYGEKFHGNRQDEEYTDENVYWLTVDAAAPGLRMTTRDVTPTGAPAGVCRVTAVAERNLRYWARASTNPGTLTTWFWEYTNIAPPTVVTRSYPLVLPAPLTTGDAATLVVELASFNYNDSVNPDHHVRLLFNGTALGDFYWDGKTGYVITTTVPAAALLTGNNTLRVAYVTDVGHQSVYFDRAELTYRQSPVASNGTLVCAALTDAAATYTVTNWPAGARLYDVSDPLRPVALVNGGATFADAAPVGTRYLAEVPRPVTPTRYTPDASLLAPSTGADEIIIAPRHFFAALQPLVAQRQAQGVRVQVVAVEDIYPLFNGGVFHPEAIRAFVAYAHATWPGPAVKYLFLVGDGNFNFKGYNPASYGPFTPTWIPPYREFADPSQGDVPVDSRFGDVNGDGFPEVYVGRLSAQTVDEVTAYVTKVLAYEAQPPSAWQLHALLVADNGETSDEGFDSQLERLRTLFPTALTTQSIYMEAYCPPALTPCPAATDAVTQAWNAGAGLLVYSGHGSIHRWAHEPLIFNTHLTALTQTTALPFLLSLDCWDGYWMFPPLYPSLPGRDVRSIGEWATTVLTETGAIAAYGPAGLAFSSSEETAARAMFRAAFQQGVFNLGELTQLGRQAIRTLYEARTYTLLGDPALTLPWWLRLRITPSALTVQPGQAVNLAALLLREGDTRFGQTFPVTPTWTVDVGTLDAYGVYTAPSTPTTARLTGHLGPLSATVLLAVSDSPPVTLTVTPDPLRIAVGKSAQMTATPYDAYGNPLPVSGTLLWSTDVGLSGTLVLGQIDANGLFTAPTIPATGWITASLPISQGTNTVLLSGAAWVEVFEKATIYLPLVLRQ